MLIHGKERKFMLTVGASVGVAQLCPGGDIARIGEVLSPQGGYQGQVDAVSQIIIEMNRGYEMARCFEEPGYTPNVITKEELLALPPAVFKEVQFEALEAFRGDVAPTVEAEPAKKKDEEVNQ